MSELNRQERLAILIETGQALSQEIPVSVISSAIASNLWFTKDSIAMAVSAIVENYLNEEALTEWMHSYPEPHDGPKKVGLILAGNIPLVGIQDVISVFASGHKSIIKLSERDSVLMNYFLSLIMEIDPRCESYFEKVERLTDYDAVIATGSNTSARYFEKYFGSVPHIIRKNRNGVAVVYKDSTDEQMQELAHDILGHYGLGCRNVSKVYLEEGVELGKVFEALEDLKTIKHHNKYMNNYDYSYALYLLNEEEFYTNDYLIMRPHKSLGSRIACLHYEYFTDATLLSNQIEEIKEEIQCIVSDRPLSNLAILPFGKGQSPRLTDYADGVDTMAFLSKV